MIAKKSLLYKFIILVLCFGVFLSTFSFPLTAEATDGNTSGDISNEQPGEAAENASSQQPGDATKGARAGGDVANPADPSPKSFDVELDFLSNSPGLSQDCTAGADMKYYDGGEATVPCDYITAENGVASVTLTSGRIYMFHGGVSDVNYMPDMGGVIQPDGGADFWVYVDESGPKLVNINNFDQLMVDPAFSGLIDGFLKTNDASHIAERYATTSDMGHYPTEERMRELLKEYIRTLSKDITVTNSDGSYELALKFSKREIKPLKIVAVDEDGAPIPNLQYGLRTITSSGHDGSTGDDGLVFNSGKGENMEQMGFYILTIQGGSRNESATSYIRKNANNIEKYPADTYALAIYVGPEGPQVVTPDNYDELSEDLQFQETVLSSTGAQMYTTLIKDMLMTYPGVAVDGEEINLPFTPWKSRPTVAFKAVKQNNDPLNGIHFYGYGEVTPKVYNEICRVTIPAPGLWRISASDSDYEYMAAHEAFRYNGESGISTNRGGYVICLWVTLDGTVELVDDTKLKELCEDPEFLDMMAHSRGDSSWLLTLMGSKADYKTIKQSFNIPGDYTLEKEKIADSNEKAYLLPFTNDYNPTLEGKKDETIVGVQEGGTPTTLTYNCPEDGTYRFGWNFSYSYYNDDVTVELTGPDGNAINIAKTPSQIQLKAGKYTINISKKSRYIEGYLKVFVDKISKISEDADLRTADYIKDGSRYSNMVSFSCGNEMKHMILARYPGDLEEGFSWAFNVAMPSGADYIKDSLKIQYLRDPATHNGTTTDPGYNQIKDKLIKNELPSDKLVTLDTTQEWTKADSFNDKTICSLSLDKAEGLQAGDLMVITYTSKVNTAAWYGSIADSNKSYGYWSTEDSDGDTIDVFNKLVSVYNPSASDGSLVDPAICQVFGIKIYKYSNYDRMMSESTTGFEQDVLLQEHLLKGAEFKIEGENLSKIIVLRDDLVEMKDTTETAASPALLSDPDKSAKASSGANAGAALAKLVDEETMMKLIYYRYEQGLQDLSKVSVAQTQTYYSLKDDDLYTRVAPKSDTMQFYADNGQGYKLKPTAFSAKAGETIKAGDGGGLLLGGLGVGEYTLTEVKAPDGYAKIKPVKISISWVKRATDDPYDRNYLELDENEVPDRSGAYGLLCKIDGVVTPVLMNSFAGGGEAWFPGYEYSGSNVPGFESIWNPLCYVLVNPIGDDRISFAAVKEVNDPADKDKEFTLKFTIKDPQGNICKDVKYAICQEDGQFETAKDVIPVADGWGYNLKPGEKIAFLNLQEGSTYEVTEKNEEYIVSYENNTGTIKYDGDSYPTAVVTNKKVELSISKTVTGEGDTNRNFTFRVDLKDANGNELKDVTCIKGETKFKISSGETIQLKHGESVTLYVPIGTQYNITELEANKDGYTSSAENNQGTISADALVINATFVNDKAAKPKPGNNDGDKPGNNNGDKPTSGNDKGDEPSLSPVTEDNSNIAVWLTLMMLSMIGLSLALFRFRKLFCCKNK